MDSSLQSANLTADELDASLATQHQDTVHGEGEEPHIHLPNPSLWPVILNIAIIVAIAGMLFIPANPWITIVAVPFVVIGILGWALEDPMAPIKERFATIVAAPSRFQLGQEVIDKDGVLLGKVQARFGNKYILVERGGLFVKTYYVPQDNARSNSKKNIVLLSLSEDELESKGMTSVPEDLYDESPEYGAPRTTGIAQFANGPLSPAETGHYNYGPNSPGINTDASGSYHRDEVRPIPQKYVGERHKLYATSRRIPARATNPE